jgi:hypothetical protein
MTQAGSDLLQPATPVGGHVAGTHHLDPGRTLRSTDEIRRCPLRLPPQRPLEPKRRDPSATTQTETRSEYRDECRAAPPDGAAHACYGHGAAPEVNGAVVPSAGSQRFWFRSESPPVAAWVAGRPKLAVGNTSSWLGGTCGSVSRASVVAVLIVSARPPAFRLRALRGSSSSSR